MTTTIRTAALLALAVILLLAMACRGSEAPTATSTAQPANTPQETSGEAPLVTDAETQPPAGGGTEVMPGEVMPGEGVPGEGVPGEKEEPTQDPKIPGSPPPTQDTEPEDNEPGTKVIEPVATPDSRETEPVVTPDSRETEPVVTPDSPEIEPVATPDSREIEPVATPGSRATPMPTPTPGSWMTEPLDRRADTDRRTPSGRADESSPTDGTLSKSESSPGGGEYDAIGDIDEHSEPVHPDRGGRGGGQRPASVPQAGEIDDNELWEEYLNYRNQSRHDRQVEDRSVQERYLVRVVYNDGVPAQGATVTFEDERGRILHESATHADGKTVFHHNSRVTKDMSKKQVIISVHKGGTWQEKIWTSTTLDRAWEGAQTTLTLPTQSPPRQDAEVDVLFLLDATGSMSDEIDRIKETLTSIAERVRNLDQDPDLRMGMVAYRDRGDAYVTRMYDFDDDIRRFERAVREVRAAGGGDYPESLNEGLHVALADVSWRKDAVKLVFLIADAPPHLDYDQDYDYAEEMLRANEDGVKIFAVASSGLDDTGEYIFRQLAQQTLGKFIFLLYDDGRRGLKTPHEVGEEFSVERLDRLIVRLITEEVEALDDRYPTTPVKVWKHKDHEQREPVYQEA